MSESDMSFGRRTGKAPERSNFTQACTLLSQFIKEKIYLENPEAKEKLETILPSTMSNNYPTNINGLIRSRSSLPNGVVASKSSDFFQMIVGSGAEDSHKLDLGTTKTTTQATKLSEIPSAMTIFYSGQVLVFNDLPTEKADEIIAMARKGSSNVNGSLSKSNPVVVETIDLTDPSSPDEKPIAESTVHVEVLRNKPEIVVDINKRTDEEDYRNPNINSVTKNESLPRQRQRSTDTTNGSDLPIARRNSLHRFLEKRKDRVGSKAPYQVPNRPAIVPPKSNEGSSRGDEGSEKQLELKL